MLLPAALVLAIVADLFFGFGVRTLIKRPRPAAQDQGDGNIVLSMIFGALCGIGFTAFAGTLLAELLGWTKGIIRVAALAFAFFKGLSLGGTAWTHKKSVQKLVFLLIALAGGYTILAYQGVLPKVWPSMPSKTAAEAALPTATVTADSLNFRSAPDMSSKVLKKGDTLTVTGAVQNGWLPARHEDTEGWVSGDMVKVGE